MTLLIKGLEMPKEGRLTLQISAGGAVYVVNSCDITAETYTTDAVPVSPHGRLIDADAMAFDETDAYLSAQIAIASAGDKDSEYEALMDINDLVHKKLQMLLKDTPTVIEAEEG